ncbi:MAG: hypothetical protein HY402_03835 [Elusimicrobia bacterium]|nr:hypothetical protein [Elusimicrobiota bacterium]
MRHLWKALGLLIFLAGSLSAQEAQYRSISSCYGSEAQDCPQEASSRVTFFAGEAPSAESPAVRLILRALGFFEEQFGPLQVEGGINVVGYDPSQPQSFPDGRVLVPEGYNVKERESYDTAQGISLRGREVSVPHGTEVIWGPVGGRPRLFNDRTILVPQSDLLREQSLSDQARWALSEVVASLWWGGRVPFAAAGEAWIPRSLARYSAFLLEEKEGGKAAYDAIRRNTMIQAMTFTSDKSLVSSGGLEEASPEYDTLISRGAAVLHMLRNRIALFVASTSGQKDDSAFFAFLRNLQQGYAGEGISYADLKKEAEGLEVPVPEGLPSWKVLTRGFFGQWVDSGRIPEWYPSKILTHTQAGEEGNIVFKVIGSLRQKEPAVEFFQDFLELRVSLENPETQERSFEDWYVWVSGKAVQFERANLSQIPILGGTGIEINPNWESLVLDPKMRFRILINKGWQLSQRGRQQEAVGVYNQALGEDPTSSRALFLKGLSFFLQGNWQLAIESFEEAASLTSDRQPPEAVIFSLLYRGYAFDNVGARGKAKASYAKATEYLETSGLSENFPGLADGLRRCKQAEQGCTGVPEDPAFPGFQ